MYVKLPSGDLNLSPYPPYPTSISTCRVTTIPRMHGSRKYKLVIVVALTNFECRVNKVVLIYSGFWGLRPL